MAVSLDTGEAAGLDGGLPRPPSKPHRLARHRWILRRIVIGVVTLVFVSVVLFAATEALPSNAAQAILGHSQDPVEVRALEKQLGLDRSVPSQYFHWANNILHGNLGTSLVAHEPVTSLLGPAIANSALLVAFSAIMSIFVSVVIGVLAAAKRDRLFDAGFTAFTFVFTAVPEFVIGLALVILFATTVFVIFPAVSLIPPGTDPLSKLSSFVLPTVTLVLAVTPYLARLVRASMIDVLETDYIQTARLKGLSERRILFRHALPNALVPAIQGVAVALGYLAGGIVLVEYVFGFPGVGTALVQAISARDLPTIQADGLLLASVFVVVNLLADILVVYVTPRLRTAQV